MSSAAVAGKHRQQGFTLIEILVVVVIIGVLLSATVALRGGHSEQRTLLAEAERLKSVLQLARQQALSSGLPLRLQVAEERYLFEVFQPDYADAPPPASAAAVPEAGLGLKLLQRQPGGQWRQAERSALREYRPQRPLRFQLRLNSRSESADKLLIAADGSSPGFELQFYLTDQPERVLTLTGDGLSAPDYRLADR